MVINEKYEVRILYLFILFLCSHIPNFDFQVATTLKNPDSEIQNKIHSLCVAFWPSFALKLGLEVGLADTDLASLSTTASFTALVAAWLYVPHSCVCKYNIFCRNIGLLSRTDEGKVILSEMGARLKLDLPDRHRANYWLGTPLYRSLSFFFVPMLKAM